MNSNSNGQLDIKLTTHASAHLFVDEKQTFTFDKDKSAICLSLPEGKHRIRLTEEHRLLRPKWWLRTFVPFRFFGHAFLKDRLGEPSPGDSFASIEFDLPVSTDSHAELELVLHTYAESTGREKHYFSCEKAHGISPERFSAPELPPMFAFRYLFEKLLPIAVMLIAFTAVSIFFDAPIWLPIVYAALGVIRMFYLFKRLKE